MPVTADERARIERITARPRPPIPDLEKLALPDWPEPAILVTRAVWQRRVQNETQSHELAQVLLESFAQVGALDLDVESALKRLAGDEATHAELAGAFVERLGARREPVAPAFARPDDQSWELYLLRCVATGLFVCETVSALRYATVRRHTTVPIARACIDLFLRDEIAHAHLGYALLPHAISIYAAHTDQQEALRALERELTATFRHLERVVGMDAARRGHALVRRPQPTPNAGVVEPASDAIAFYDAIARTVVPRLARLGVDGEGIWRRRFGSEQP